MNINQVMGGVKELSSKDKALVAHCLIASLESRQDAGVDEAWGELAERRPCLGLTKLSSVLWDGGHIKIWLERTLRTLLTEAGFRDIMFVRVGRILPLACSMIAVFRR